MEHTTEKFVKTECEIDDSEEIDCWNCEDKGFFVTVGGLEIPCPDCKTGDMFFYHEREKDLAAMVHVDDLLPGVDPEYDG